MKQWQQHRFFRRPSRERSQILCNLLCITILEVYLLIDRLQTAAASSSTDSSSGVGPPSLQSRLSFHYLMYADPNLLCIAIFEACCILCTMSVGGGGAGGSGGSFPILSPPPFSSFPAVGGSFPTPFPKTPFFPRHSPIFTNY